MRAYLDEIGGSIADSEDLDDTERTALGRHVVPGLLNHVAGHGLQVRVGHDLATVTRFLAGERRRDARALDWFTMYDEACWPDVDPSKALFCYLTQGEEIVGSIGSRLFWCERTLGDSLQSLRLFYADPKRMAEPGEQCLVTAERAFQMRSAWVAFNCAGYVVERLRGGTLYEALSRLCRIATLVSWRWTYLVALVEERVARKLGFERYGHAAAHPHVLHRIPGREPGEDVCQLMVSERAHMRALLARTEVADATAPLLRTSEERWIEARTA